MAATWSAADNFMQILINDTQVAASFASLPTFDLSGQTLRIGAGLDGASPADALIDELRISAISRTAREITQTFRSGLGITP